MPTISSHNEPPPNRNLPHPVHEPVQSQPSYQRIPPRETDQAPYRPPPPREVTNHEVPRSHVLPPAPPFIQEPEEREREHAESLASQRMRGVQEQRGSEDQRGLRGQQVQRIAERDVRRVIDVRHEVEGREVPWYEDQVMILL